MIPFSDRYLEICRRLHEIRPRALEEWQWGDWGQWRQPKSGELDEPDLWCYFTDEELCKSPPEVWVPTRESDWMRQPEWPTEWSLWFDPVAKGWTIMEDVRDGNLIVEKSKVIVFEKEGALLACAEAWLLALARQDSQESQEQEVVP